ARRVRRGTAIRQGKYRSAIGGRSRCRVGMNRNEQVSAFLAGNLGALAQRNKVIAGAHQLGTEAFFSIDLALQLLRDLQYHMLLVNFPRRSEEHTSELQS